MYTLRTYFSSIKYTLLNYFKIKHALKWKRVKGHIMKCLHSLFVSLTTQKFIKNPNSGSKNQLKL